MRIDADKTEIINKSDVANEIVIKILPYALASVYTKMTAVIALSHAAVYFSTIINTEKTKKNRSA